MRLPISDKVTLTGFLKAMTISYSLSSKLNINPVELSEG